MSTTRSRRVPAIVGHPASPQPTGGAPPAGGGTAVPAGATPAGAAVPTDPGGHAAGVNPQGPSAAAVAAAQGPAVNPQGPAANPQGPAASTGGSHAAAVAGAATPRSRSRAVAARLLKPQGPQAALAFQVAAEMRALSASGAYVRLLGAGAPVAEELATGLVNAGQATLDATRLDNEARAAGDHRNKSWDVVLHDQMPPFEDRFRAALADDAGLGQLCPATVAFVSVRSQNAHRSAATRKSRKAAAAPKASGG